VRRSLQASRPETQQWTQQLNGGVHAVLVRMDVSDVLMRSKIAGEGGDADTTTYCVEGGAPVACRRLTRAR
jgi:hypothetical protein